jgi:acetyl esterase/lipase
LGKSVKIVLYFHGGGFVSGDTNEAFLRQVCEKYVIFFAILSLYLQLRDPTVLAISVDYSFVPESRWPVQLNECFCVYEFLHTNDWNLVPDQILLAGET